MRLFSPSVAYQHVEEKLQLYRQYGCHLLDERLNFLKWVEFLPQPIVEIGSGRGYFTLCLAKMGYDVVSIDLDEETIEFTNALLEYFGLENKVRLLVGDVTVLKNIKPASVVSFNLWHHIDDADDFISAVVDVSPKLIAMVDFSDEGFLLTDKLHHMVYGNSHLVIQSDLERWKLHPKMKSYDFFCYNSRFERGFCALRKELV